VLRITKVMPIAIRPSIKTRALAARLRAARRGGANFANRLIGDLAPIIRSQPETEAPPDPQRAHRLCDQCRRRQLRHATYADMAQRWVSLSPPTLHSPSRRFEALRRWLGAVRAVTIALTSFWCPVHRLDSRGIDGGRRTGPQVHSTPTKFDFPSLGDELTIESF
jgi:hypothetical protein